MKGLLKLTYGTKARLHTENGSGGGGGGGQTVTFEIVGRGVSDVIVSL